MSKVITWGLALLISVTAFTEVQAQERISFGTTRTQSSTYTYAVAAAKAINSISGDKVSITVISTGGAVDNLARLSKRQIRLGLGNLATAYQQFHGTGKFKGKAAPQLRVLWTYQTTRQAFLVRKDSNITELSQLAGKKWTAGQRGSGTENLVVQVFDALGIKPNYYRATLADAIKAIKDKKSIGFAKAMQGKSLDAASRELDVTIGVRILGFNDAQKKIVKEKFPFLAIADFKDGEVSGHPAFSTISSASGIFTYTDMLTDDQITAILKGVFDGKDIQDEAYPPFRNRDIAAESLANFPIPMHKAAVKFYRERGYDVPDHLIPPEMK
jgi:TRAP transporter TAXI family solute receptor